MTTLTTEQAQQIEEALEDIVRVFQFETGTPVEALAVIRAARAQEQVEQEPVGVVEGSGEWGIAGVLVAGVPIGTKLYTAPVRTKDLTDGAIWEILETHPTDIITAIRAVITADREKNK